MLNSLNVAQSGLASAKVSVENVMNNIANANTEGYKKRVVETSELSHADSRITGRGVMYGDVTRISSQYMYDNIIKETSKENYYNELSNKLAGVESVFKESDESGLSADLDRYYQAIENLRANPHNELYKNDLKIQAQTLVDSMKRLYEGIEEQEALSVKSLEDDVSEINTILKDIGSINRQIIETNVASNDLLDKRDLLEKELAKYVDVSIDRTNEHYELKIGGEVAVRYDNVRELTVAETLTHQQDRFTDDVFGSQDVIKAEFGLFGFGDSFTYELDNTSSVTVTFGDTFTDAQGNIQTVNDDSNLIQAIVSKINSDINLSSKVVAYNGEYSLDENGNKIPDTGTTDNFLIIESKLPGEKNSFDSKITTHDTDGSGPPSITLAKEVLFKTPIQSSEATTTVGVQLFDEDITVTSGALKVTLDNLKTDSGSNKFQEYKDDLDSFAFTLADITSSYIKNGDNDYIHGEIATDQDDGTNTIVDINLFTGSSVENLVFNENVVNGLEQKDYDYLSTHQWKEDISFQGFGQSSTIVNADDEKTSFTQYFQDLKVSISRDKENADFLADTQRTVTESLKNSYDNLVKVDNDEEMINLIKFQAAYTANAKIVTVVDEMLQTLLGLKR